MSRTARETVEELLRRITADDRSKIADLYDPDVVIENPFAPQEFPGVARGRERIREQMKVNAGLWRFDRVEQIGLHETADPEVVVVEYRVHGRISAGEEPFVLSFVMVIRVRDGLIVTSRDYSNPLEAAVLARAMS
jgi:ketosteroid isomerase-like protein